MPAYQRKVAPFIPVLPHLDQFKSRAITGINFSVDMTPLPLSVQLSIDDSLIWAVIPVVAPRNKNKPSLLEAHAHWYPQTPNRNTSSILSLKAPPLFLVDVVLHAKN
jgi:hypothetical protein